MADFYCTFIVPHLVNKLYRCVGYLSVVVECPELLLMFSLLVSDKEFLCCVMDIVSVFADKLVLIVERHLMTWLSQCLPVML